MPAFPRHEIEDLHLVVARRNLDDRRFRVQPPFAGTAKEFEPIDGKPVHAIVFERVRHQPHVRRHALAAAAGQGGHAPLDLVARLRMNRMRGLRPDEVRELNALLEQRQLHHVGGLLLAVDLAAVGYRRAMPQVRRPAVAVVEVP